MNARVSIWLFEGFAPLDVFGPVQLFLAADGFEVSLAGPSLGTPVRAAGDIEVLPHESYEDAMGGADVLLVPGGQGTRPLVEVDRFLEVLAAAASGARVVAGVCTGSALLAAAGLLDGYRATTNKRAYEWATSHGQDVTWVPHARWVADRDRWTSSGVAAGMDMAAALIADLASPEVAQAAADHIEYVPAAHWDDDPFAERYGL